MREELLVRVRQGLERETHPIGECSEHRFWGGRRGQVDPPCAAGILIEYIGGHLLGQAGLPTPPAPVKVTRR